MLGSFSVKNAWAWSGFQNQSAQRDEQTANYALGGMMTGLIAGGILLRNMDEKATLPITPTIGKSGTATIVGLGGMF